MKTRPGRGFALHGFTLVELLVVIAIIGVMIAITVPALMASRETGRRSLCQARLSQIVLALQNYENAFESFPAGVVNPGGPIRNEEAGLHQAWTIPVLPYLDEPNAYARVDQHESVYAPANAEVRAYWPEVFVCPSEREDVAGASSYAGCHHDVEAPIAADNRGMLYLNSRIRRDDVTDGLAHTILVGEKRTFPGDLGWMSGTRATLRNTGARLNDEQEQAGMLPVAAPDDEAAAAAALLYVGGFASCHPSGAHVGFADASVQFVADDVDLILWQRLGNRADGQLTTPPGSAP